MLCSCVIALFIVYIIPLLGQLAMKAGKSLFYCNPSMSKMQHWGNNGDELDIWMDMGKHEHHCLYTHISECVASCYFLKPLCSLMVRSLDASLAREWNCRRPVVPCTYIPRIPPSPPKGRRSARDRNLASGEASGLHFQSSTLLERRAPAVVLARRRVHEHSDDETTTKNFPRCQRPHCWLSPFPSSACSRMWVQAVPGDE